MTKREFLGELRFRLRGFDEAEVQSALTYYAEMIEDKIDSGLSEADAVASLGDTRDIVAELKSELRRKRINGYAEEYLAEGMSKKGRREQTKKLAKGTPSLVLALVFSPVLFPLGIALVAVLIALTATFGGLIVGFGAASFSLIISAIAMGAQMLVSGAAANQIIFIIGGLLAAAGITGLLFTLTLKAFIAVIAFITRKFSRFASNKMQREAVAV